MSKRAWRARLALGQEGYVLLMAVALLLLVLMMTATLAIMVSRNQSHVARDRSYTESLAVAEAGLNRYLWMVASSQSCEQNGFAIPGCEEGSEHKVTSTLTDAGGKTIGTYTMEVTPPDKGQPLKVSVTGQAASTAEAPRTVTAAIGRPSFSEYVLLTNEPVFIGGGYDNQRQWWGRTHSNTSVRIDTYNINDRITCSVARDSNGNDGVYSPVAIVTNHENSKLLWEFPVPVVNFATVTSDFSTLMTMATNAGSAYPQVAPQTWGGAHGWYIRLGPDDTYQVARVTEELEDYRHDIGGEEWGGYLRYEYQTGVPGSLSPPITYPPNGVIFVHDNVWVEGTDVTTRITIAASGQFNEDREDVDINVVGDLTYEKLDGSAAIGLIAQHDVKIPMYAPMGVTGTPGTSWNSTPPQIGDCNMTIHGALIAQTGCEYVNRSSTYGPRRGTLTIIGSVSSFLTPSRAYTSTTGAYGGFGAGVNDYDPYLLRTPPPSFPTVDSFQVLEWQELPSTMGVESGG